MKHDVETCDCDMCASYRRMSYEVWGVVGGVLIIAALVFAWMVG